MACYPCTRCNACGMYSAQVRTVCAECSAPFPIGQPTCEVCGSTKVTTVIIDPSESTDDQASEGMSQTV